MRAYLTARSLLSLGDDFLERAPLYMFHHEVLQIPIVAHTVELDDVGMRYLRRGVGFMAETLDELFVFLILFLEHFKGNHALAFFIKRLIHHAHAARTDAFEYPIAVGNDFKHRRLR